MAAHPAARAGGARGRAGWAAAILAGAVLAAYLPALRNGFVWDDDATLTRNPVVTAADGLRRIWGTTEARDCWPVTYSALWAEWHLWGPHPLGYHAVSVALHLATVLLLWRVLRRIWGEAEGAWLAAALFALHPVNVESVAWITQQKNLLALLFSLASVCGFLRAERAGGARYCGLALLAFALAMLSKGSAAPLPIILTGLLRWERPLVRRDVARLAPFFLVALLLVAVNVWFQARVAGGVAVRNAGPLERVLGAAAAGWFYLGHALAPARLAFIYPEWHIRTGDWRWWLPLAGGLALTGWLARAALGNRPAGSATLSFWSEMARPALLAWGYFWVALIPALGFVDVYFMRYSLVADHYEHLAIIGVAVLAAAAWRALARRVPAPAFRVGPLLVLLALGGLTWRQTLVYRDSRTLYRATIERNPGAWLAHFNLGEMLLEEGKVPEAIGHFEAALRAKPGHFEAHNDLGIALAEANRLPEAGAQFGEAVRLNPGYAPAHVNLGKIRLHERRLPEAIAQFREAARLAPDNAEAHRALGLVLRAAGREGEAGTELETAGRLDRRR